MSVCWSRSEKYLNQFVAVDEIGEIGLWECGDVGKKRKMKFKHRGMVSGGMLSSVDIEPKEGKMVAAGGVDTKLYILGINPDTKKKEKVDAF